MTEVITLRDLPGVAELEAALHVPGRHLLKEYDDLEDRIAAASRRLFGLSKEETEFIPAAEDVEIIRWPMAPRGEEWRRFTDRAEGKLAEWESHFEFLDHEYEEEDVFWSAFGWDVTDGAGEQLAIMDYFGRPLVCLLKRLHARSRLSLSGDDPLIRATPEEAEREAEEWGRRLAEEARRHKRTG
jgi:hypothetical protein